MCRSSSTVAQALNFLSEHAVVEVDAVIACQHIYGLCDDCVSSLHSMFLNKRMMNEE